MQQNHAGLIRGLSIATIIFSGLGIILGFGGLIFISTHSADFSDLTIQYMYDDDYYMPLNRNSYESEFLSGFLMTAMVGLFIWQLICSVVSLIAGIFGIRFNDSRDQLGKVMGWAIAGASTSFLSGHLVAMVLLIIIAVFSYRDRYVQQPPYGTYAYGYGAPYQTGGPYQGQPGQPYYQGQPQQPYNVGQQPPQQPHQNVPNQEKPTAAPASENPNESHENAQAPQQSATISGYEPPDTSRKEY